MAERGHPDILETLTKNILPYVVRIQGMNIPWPAELWVDGERKHGEGIAMFNIGERGFLTAEYFGYDDADLPLVVTLPDFKNASLVMGESQAAIPVWNMRSSPKTRTIYSRVGMPAINGYELDIQGWIGGSRDTQMRSATITLGGLPDLHLPRTTLPAPDDDHGSFTMRGTTSSNAVLTLEAGDWRARLQESQANLGHGHPRVHHVVLRKKDDSPFCLRESLAEEPILDSLYKYLSFQCGRWITLSTILCAPSDTDDWVVQRAWTGRLIPPVQRHESSWTATGWMKWPNLFEQFWRQYTSEDSREHLENAVHHYVECQSVFHGGAIDYALVAAQSTLQALVRWWNELDASHRFDGRRNRHFKEELPEAVEKAELGRDSGMDADICEIRKVEKKARGYRNDIDHGRGGNILGRSQEVVDCGMYYTNLARLLILAKLGDRNRDARGNLTGPSFKSSSSR